MIKILLSIVISLTICGSANAESKPLDWWEVKLCNKEKCVLIDLTVFEGEYKIDGVFAIQMLFGEGSSEANTAENAWKLIAKSNLIKSLSSGGVNVEENGGKLKVIEWLL